MNTVEQFIDRVKGDTALQARIKQAGSAEAVVSIAQDLGYRFSAAQFQTATETLSDDALNAVTGGCIGAPWGTTVGG